MNVKSLQFTASAQHGDVSAVCCRPPEARFMLVLGHGAGAGMHHPFMEQVSAGLAGRGVGTFRYNFPYMERGSRRPDPTNTLTATVRASAHAAACAAPDLPLLAGGKSMGGRMTSLAAAAQPLPGVAGLVFLGFPLHAAGRPATGRGDHLRDVGLPMLFVQGTRDKLADLDLLTPVCSALGTRARLHIIEGADHGFHVLKRSGRTDGEVLAEIAETVAEWANLLVRAS